MKVQEPSNNNDCIKSEMLQVMPRVSVTNPTIMRPETEASQPTRNE